MKYLTGNRGSGVSTSIILEASLCNATIITQTQRQKQLYEVKARELGVQPPKVVVVGTTDVYKTRDEDHLIIDNLHLVVNKLLADAGIRGRVVTVGDTTEGTV